SGTTVSACRERTRAGDLIARVPTSGAAYTKIRLSDAIATAIRASLPVRRPISPIGADGASTTTRPPSLPRPLPDAGRPVYAPARSTRTTLSPLGRIFQGWTVEERVLLTRRSATSAMRGERATSSSSAQLLDELLPLARDPDGERRDLRQPRLVAG